MDLEGGEGVLVVGRDEDHRRHGVGADLFDDPETVEAGHLDVEKDQIGLLRGR